MRYQPRPLGLRRPPPTTPICLARQSGEIRKSLNPLIQQNATVNEDQGLQTALGDHSYADDGLAECRGRCEHAAIVVYQS